MSRAVTNNSFADLRRATTAIVVGTAGPSTEGAVTAQNPLNGAATTQATFTVERTLWGKALPSTIVVDQLGGTQAVFADRELLRDGQQYLLFVRPDDLQPGKGMFNIAGDGQYRLVGDAYQKVSTGPDRLPATMTAEQAPQLVIS